MGSLTNAVRAGTAEFIKPKPAVDETPPEPTTVEEGKQVLHHIHANYRSQLVPFKTAAAAVVAAAVLQDQGPAWGALLLIPALAYGAWVTTNFQHGWRPLGKGRFEYTDPTGRRAARIKSRSWRAAACFALIGVWLNLIALTGPVRLLSLPVWLAGAILWAVISDEGWWRPARQANARPQFGFTAQPTHHAAAAADADQDGEHDQVPAPVHRSRRSQASAPTRPGGRPAPHTPAPPAATLPSLDVFRRSPIGVTPAVEDLSGAIQDVIERAGVNARVQTEPLRGPRTTRYAIRPAPGQDPKKLSQLTKAIEYACKGASVTFLDPIPGTGDFGVEVARPDPDLVTLRELLTSPYARAEKHPMMVALGKDTEGNHILVNLTTLPHILIGGTTGGGKSVCLHCLLNSLLARATPKEVRLILIDPKKVELSAYAGVPHLLFPIIADTTRALNALEWLVDEMETRYDKQAANGVRNITEYNLKVAKGEISGDPMHYIVGVIDELADLMMVAGKETETYIVRLAQKARGAGIHLVLATQQPVVKVVTGLIKANVPARLAFVTASNSDSRVIIDQPGAEKLLGAGDSLFKPKDRNKPVRVQGAWVTEEEIVAVVQHWKTQPLDGVTVPNIDLDRARQIHPDPDRDPEYDDYAAAETAPNGRTPARVIVLSKIILHADDDGNIDREKLRSVTPNIGEDNCNLALSQLRNTKPHPLIEDVSRGVYRATPAGRAAHTAHTNSPEES